MSRLLRAAAAALCFCVAGVGALQGVAGRAEAQGAMCTTLAKMDAALREKFKEVPVGSGAIATAGTARLYLSDEGTFTIIVVAAADNTACIAVAGHSFAFARHAPTKPGEPL